MSTAVLMLSLILPLHAPYGSGGHRALQMAANESYCGRTAEYALQLALRNGDEDLAGAAQLVRDVALNQRHQLDSVTDRSDVVARLAAHRAQHLAAEFERLQSRNVLADALVGCAASL